MPSLDAAERAELVRIAIEHGVRVEERNGKHIFYPTNGFRPISIHGTISDSRGWRNVRMNWRKAGLPWPWDAYTAPKQKEETMTITAEKPLTGPQKVEQYIAEFDGDRIRAKQIIQDTGVSQPTVTKWLNEHGWIATHPGKGDRRNEWVRPRSVEITHTPTDHELVEEVAARVEHHELTADDVAVALSNGSQERHDEIIAEMVNPESEVDIDKLNAHVEKEHEAINSEAYALGEAAGYEQAHNELQPQIDELKTLVNDHDASYQRLYDKLREKQEVLNAAIEANQRLGQENEALELSNQRLEQDLRKLEKMLLEDDDQERFLQARITDLSNNTATPDGSWIAQPDPTRSWGNIMAEAKQYGVELEVRARRKA